MRTNIVLTVLLISALGSLYLLGTKLTKANLNLEKANAEISTYREDVKKLNSLLAAAEREKADIIAIRNDKKLKLIKIKEESANAADILSTELPAELYCMLQHTNCK